MTDLQRQYIGYHETPLLWQNELLGLSQFTINDGAELSFNLSINKELRLGHLVEYFVHFDLLHDSSIDVIAKNVQINSKHTTLGEIDFIVNRENQLFQIESSYKFYLWDSSVSNNPIQNWIGPNRRDALHLKLNKIKSNQFPLLQRKETIEYLNHLNISNVIQQRVFFKGQLFIPTMEKHELCGLNKACIAGYYYRLEELIDFKNDKFFIPDKLNWLSQVHPDVSWIDYSQLMIESLEYIQSKQATIIWHKSNNGVLSKFFLVWWN